MAVPPKLDDLVSDLREADKQERTELLIDLAKGLPAVPPRFEDQRDAAHRVHECLSPVFLFVEVGDDDRAAIFADAPPEALTVRGFVGLLVEGLDGATVEDLLGVPDDLVERSGIHELVGMQRAMGLPRILRRLKAEVTRAAMARASAL